MKRSFTKNLAMLVKKPDNSGVFDAYLLFVAIVAIVDFIDCFKGDNIV